MIVKGEGDEKSKLYIIGEAPGRQEEEQGQPFVGGAGQLLNRLLAKAGLQRGECYIDNVIQERPPSNDFGVYYSDRKRTKCLQTLLVAHQRLRRQIEANRPNVVVALGNEPLFALTGHKNILKWRGSILNANGTKVIPTVHPAAILREPKLEPIAVMDFERIAQEAKSPLMPQVYRDRFIINPTFNQVMTFLTRELPMKDIVAFDIETIPDLEQIICIGFAWDVDEAFCIPIFYGQQSWWTAEEEMTIVKAIRNAFKLPLRWIAQNAQYDLTYLMDKWGVSFPSLWMDTMIAFHTVYPEMRKSLAFLTSIYTYRPYYKDDGGVGANPEQEWIYNCKDTCVTYECALAIRKEMEEFKTLNFYEAHSNKLIQPLIQMQRRGVLIDIQRRADLDRELSEKEVELQARINKAVGHLLNVNSPKQVKEFLYDDLGLPPIYAWGTKAGKKIKVVSTSEDAIEELQRRTQNPVLQLILEVRGIHKLLGTYVRAPLEASGRICCSYKISGTETGRLSSSVSVYGRGTALQTIPREASIRSMFIPDPGCILINADLSQAEVRLVAYLAREERMIAVFESGRDIHTMNAAAIFSCHYNQVTPEQRQIAKSRVHGANYGIGPAKAAKLTGTTEAEAREDLNKYKCMYPNLEIWWREVREQVGKTRIMSTPFGRRRMFFDRWSDDLVREAIAYVPQSTVGDLLNFGIIRCWRALPPGWELLMQNHDSIVAQVPEETDLMHIIKFFKHYFEIPLTIYGRTFKIPIDIKVGKSWGEMEDIGKKMQTIVA